jgi:Glutaminyl-tRNA synthetase, non-specific RNA binding region part 1
MVLQFFQAENVLSPGSDLDKTAGNLLYIIATKLKSQIVHHRRLLAEYVGRKDITSELQLTGKCFLLGSIVGIE